MFRGVHFFEFMAPLLLVENQLTDRHLADAFCGLPCRLVDNRLVDKSVFILCRPNVVRSSVFRRKGVEPHLLD